MASGDADLARAYAELVKAEEHAAILEAQLQSLEDKLDAFLAEHDGASHKDNAEETTHKMTSCDYSPTVATNGNTAMALENDHTTIIPK